MQPVAPAADVGEDEGDVGVTARQRAELDRVGRFLPRPVVATMLPNVLEDGNAPLQRQDGDRIEQRIVRAAARRQLDTDHARIETPHDLGAGLRGVVRIDAHVATDRFRVRALERKECVVAGGDVPGRGKVGGRCEAETPQDRSEEHTSELQSRQYLVCRLLLEKKKKNNFGLDDPSLYKEEKYTSPTNQPTKYH